MKARLATSLVLLALAASSAFAAPLKLPVTVPAGSVWLIDSSIVIEKHSSTGSSTGKGRNSYRVELRGDGPARQLVVTQLVDGQPPTPISFEYAVDPALTPKRLNNWDEVRRLRLEGVEKSGFSAGMIADTKAMYSRISAEVAANMLVSELPLVALGQGTNLEVGTPSSSKDPMTSKGDPLISPGGEFKLVSIDAAAGRAVVTWSRRMPSEPFTDAARAQFKEMVEHTNPKASKELPAMTEEGSQSCRFEIEIATGLASRSECDLIGSNFFVNVGGSGIEHQETHMTITQTLQKKP